MNTKQAKDVLLKIQDIRDKKISKHKAYQELRQVHKSIKQSSFYNLVDNLIILCILNERDVCYEVIEEIAVEMDLYFIWKMYMEVIDIDG